MSNILYQSKTVAVRSLICVLSGLGIPAASYAQFGISGANCVVNGTQYTYTISGNWTNSTTMNWSVTGGTISGSSSGTPLPQVHITWNTPTTGTVQVNCSNPGGSGSLNVSSAATLNGGSINNNSLTQSIYYNTIPTPISTTGAQGGTCGTPNDQYQWQSSPDNTSWSNWSATSQDLTFTAALTSTTYFRRKVTETNSGNIAYTNSATVIVYPQLVGNSVTPASQTVNYGVAPMTMWSGATGGNPPFTYQWQSSPDNINWAGIQYATTTSYTPQPLGVTTYFRLAIFNGPSTAYSSSALVTVGPEVFPGIVGPSNVSILTGTSPGLLSGNPASGGSCGGSYNYQWQYSTNGSSWNNISLATNPTYSLGTVSSTTYYRRQCTCGTDIENSNVITVEIVSPSDLNYVRTREIQKAGVIDSSTAAGLTSPYDVTQITQYFDGLGRTMQTVAMQQTPLQRDMVSFNDYDNYGREIHKYLPFSDTSASGNYKYSASIDQYTFNSAAYPSEQYFYTLANMESSVLSRPLTIYPQGSNLVGTGRGVSAQALVNQANDSVRLWTIAYQPGSIPTTVGTYMPGSLFKNVKTDEAGNQIITYLDFHQREVLRKIQQAAVPGSAHVGWLCTYYIYDDLGFLRFVIQPQAILLINSTWSIPWGVANELCFRYEYDQWGRMNIKKIPGVGEMHMVYDEHNRMVMTQDSLLRSSREWLATTYDTQNRADSTVLMVDSSNYNSLPYHTAAAMSSPTYPTLQNYNYTLQTRTYYDDYSWVAGSGTALSSTMATNYVNVANDFITSLNTSPTYAVGVSPIYITRGKATGSRKLVLGTGQYLFEVNFFDDRGRIIQVQSVNYTGGIDTSTLQYDFNGKPLRNMLCHSKQGNIAQHHTIVTKMDYDHAFRLRHIWKNIDAAANDQLIDSIQYDELGRLSAKYLGNNVDSLIYNYNVRNWLSAINPNYLNSTTNHYFGMELAYDRTTSVAPGNSYITPEYNGNVGGTTWKSAGSGINRKYDFTYDPANRLTGAAFLQNTSGTTWDKNQVDFSVSNLRFDANGNILTMTQNGFLVGGSTAIDILTYGYSANGSNKLMGVIDGAQNNATSQLGDFHYTGSKTNDTTDYTYDANGNLTKDNNKNITSITYNYLDRPQSIHFQGKGTISYVYDASGAKLAKITIDSVAQHSIRTLYSYGLVYQQTGTMSNPGGATDTLQFIDHEEGRARWAYHKYLTVPPGYRLEYDFFERDHLGNTRMVLTQERDTTNYVATMEFQFRATEPKLFSNITNTCAAWTSMPNYQNIPNNIRFAYTSPNDSVSKVDYNGTSGQTTGPSLLLKVMGGDTVSLGVQCYYASNTLTTTNSSLSSVLNTLAGGILGTPTGASEGTLSGYTSSSGPVYGALSSFLSTKDPATPSGYPKAYLNWLLLDDQFNYVSSSSGSVATASSTYPANQMNTVAPGGPITMSRNGYLYVWVSNETQGWDVFFDNFSVQYKQGPVLEENHYYPFGLTMAGISDKALKTNFVQNKSRYNGKELQSQEFTDGSGLEEYDFGARFQDPQLGTWHGVDPLAEKDSWLSPYAYGLNNPERVFDPNGMDASPGQNQESLSDWNDRNQTHIEEVANHPNSPDAMQDEASGSAKALSTPSIGQNGDADGNEGNGGGPEPQKGFVGPGLQPILVWKAGTQTIELMEAVGPKVSSGFIFKALGILFTILQFEGDNQSDLSKAKRESKQIVETIANGQYSKLPKYIEYYTYTGGKVRSEIVFRYISTGELASVLPGVHVTWLPAIDKDGKPCLKYVTPTFYASAQQAQAFLALPNTPQFVILSFRCLLNIQPQEGWLPVPPANNQPGGGLEATVDGQIPIFGVFQLKK